MLVAKYLLGGYCGVRLAGRGHLRHRRGRCAFDISAGWLELKRASPMPPIAYLLSKAAMAVVFSHHHRLAC